MIKKWIQRLSAIQQHCLLCGQLSLRLICPYCHQDMPFYSSQANLLERPDFNNLFAKRDFNVLRAMMPYQSPLSSLINQMKFHSNTTAAKAMAALFIDHFEQIARPPNTQLIPVPLHAYRYMQRKYNQSGVIAQILAKHWNILYQPRSVERIKSTQPQTKMSATDRKNNVKAAFKVKSKLNCDHVIIFDDVITTGATVNQLARTLKASRPHITVEVWCLCITHLH